MRWFRKAADQGLARAQYNLGVMYFEGLGVKRDNVQAYILFNLAASRFPVSEGGERNTASNPATVLPN